MTLYLRHVRGSKSGELGSYKPPRVSIGRTDDNDLCFDPNEDGEVSGQHAIISIQGDAFVIEDLNSTNGTYVNGEKISEPVQLSEGDEIEFALGGPKVVFSTQSPRDTAFVDQKPLTSRRQKTLVVQNANTAEAGAEAGGAGGVKRIGRNTAEYMRQMLVDASNYSSKRLKTALISMAILFVCVSAGLVSSNLWQRGKIEALSVQTDEIKKDRDMMVDERAALEKQRIKLEQKTKALREEGRVLQDELGAQAKELKRLKVMMEELKRGGLTATMNSSGNVSVNLPNVTFDYNIAELSNDGRKKVPLIASVLLNRAPGRSIMVEGHASHEFGGSPEHNMRLSWARAEAVATGLRDAGISEDLITYQGFGFERPISENDSEEGRRKNRRVEVIISSE